MDPINIPHDFYLGLQLGIGRQNVVFVPLNQYFVRCLGFLMLSLQ